MSLDPSSTIRVFVKWTDQTVFAGEEIKCRITFKNVSPDPNSSPSLRSSNAGPTPNLDRPRQLLPQSAAAAARAKSSPGLTPPSSAASTVRGHRSTLSLNVPHTSASIPNSPLRNGSNAPLWSPPTHPPSHTHAASDRASRRSSHQRSISIVSITSNSTIDDRSSSPIPGPGSVPSRSQRAPGTRGHGRSSSLHILPRTGPPPPSAHASPRTATLPGRKSLPLNSPLFNASYPPDRHNGPAIGKRNSSPATTPNTPSMLARQPSPRGMAVKIPEFRFPAALPPSGAPTTNPSSNDTSGSPTPGSPTSGGPSDSPFIPVINEHTIAPASPNINPTANARVLAATSVGGGTPRSSSEFYNMSNNSSETLASEYPSQPQTSRSGRPGRPPHIRLPSGLSSSLGQSRQPETIMMGYAQVQGSFVLDGSLIQLSQFEQVKRKAVVGGQGGGVVGLETSNRNSGLLRGWGNFLGDLVGGNELSTIKEMRGAASAKTIPLLSTPQSILFVDMRLGPGQSKAFDYSFRLPKGLPPSHRGKAMKITYTLVIGTQRAGGAREQQTRTVEIPFRVLGSVNSHGEILGHDLMSPYVILRDQAVVVAVPEKHHHGSSHKKTPPKSLGPESTMNGFLGYVDELLRQSRGDGGTPGMIGGLLSPTAEQGPMTWHEGASASGSHGGRDLRRRSSAYEPLAASAKEAIDFAILRSNVTGDGQQSANRFEIARNGLRVAVVMLTRPAYRLGEVVTMAVDFAQAEIPCYAVHAALETSEKVDAGLALRSEASIHRVTRKVVVCASETTLYARRIVFTPTIPINSTPEFVTSGVCLEWKVRLEFVVPCEQVVDEGVREWREMVREEEVRREEEGRLRRERQMLEREQRLAQQRQQGRQSSGRQGRGEGDEDEELDDDDREGQELMQVTDSPGRTSTETETLPPDLHAPAHHLLEEISRDEKGGLILVAAENLVCESFEVSVPLRVYGAVCTGLEKLERDEALEEGLAI